MIQAPTVQDLLRQAFQPTPRGVAGLAEQLLAACAGHSVDFERVESGCVCRWTTTGGVQTAPVPIPPTAFRTILARIAALCKERSPDAVTPYGGDGEVTVGGERPATIRVAFVNTPDRQRLNLRPPDAEADDTVGGGDQPTTW